MRRLAFLALALLACAAPRPAAPTATADDTAFARVRDSFYDAYLAFHPTAAIRLGYHDRDGQLGDRSAAALAGEVTRLHAALDELGRIDGGKLLGPNRVERAVLMNVARSGLFDLEVRASPSTNPFFYLWQLNVQDYVTRDYAPLADRARAVVAYTRAAHGYLEDARKNLVGPIPRPWLEVSLVIVKGGIEFVHKDVRQALAGAESPELSAALDQHEQDLRAFAQFLESRRADASADFALGAERYVQALADVEGLSTDLATLERVAREDTERNLAALAEAARAVDPKKTVAEVVAELDRDKPEASQVVALATEQAESLRRFVVDHQVVAIPSADVAEVRLAPPFARINPAFISAPGPFEKKPLPAIYYISEPDPSWPSAQQKSYLQPRDVLLFTTVHEVWPGHFVQHLYENRMASRIVKSFCSYAYTEGWAHYTEEMMWQAGLGGGDPRVHIGQLLSALMRDARFLAALGLHTRGMTVDEATRLFQEKAFLPLAAARQQAMRGTLDPLYSLYTIGKLMIVKLRDDYRKKTGASLAAFHEAFLSAGCEAIPIVRRELLGDDSPAL